MSGWVTGKREVSYQLAYVRTMYGHKLHANMTKRGRLIRILSAEKILKALHILYPDRKMLKRGILITSKRT